MNINIKAGGMFLRSQVKLQEIKAYPASYSWGQNPISVELAHDGSSVSLGMSIAEARRLHDMLNHALSSDTVQQRLRSTGRHS